MRISNLTTLLTPRRWPYIAILISGGLLGGAYAFEHIGGLQPCIMCYWQRHAHKAVLAVSFAAIAASALRPSKTLARIMTLLIAAAFLISFGYGFAHIGVEQGWWEGPKVCAVSARAAQDIPDLMGALSQPMETPACSDVAWSWLGLSMAGWNALISLFGAAMSFTAALKGSRS